MKRRCYRKIIIRFYSAAHSDTIVITHNSAACNFKIIIYHFVRKFNSALIVIKHSVIINFFHIYTCISADNQNYLINIFPAGSKPYLNTLTCLRLRRYTIPVSSVTKKCLWVKYCCKIVDKKLCFHSFCHLRKPYIHIHNNPPLL